MSIYVPYIPDILHEGNTVKNKVKDDVSRITTKFIDRKLFPEFLPLKALITNATLVAEDRISKALAYSAAGDLERAVEVSGVTEIYSDKGVDCIRNFQDLEETIDFTLWLKEEYGKLFDLEVSQVANNVWQSVTYAVRGSGLNLRRGILMLGYQDESDRTKCYFLSYKRSIMGFSNRSPVYKTEIMSDTTISALHMSSNNIFRFSKQGAESLIAIRSHVPASFHQIVFPICGYFLSEYFRQLNVGLLT